MMMRDLSYVWVFRIMLIYFNFQAAFRKLPSFFFISQMFHSIMTLKRRKSAIIFQQLSVWKLESCNARDVGSYNLFIAHFCCCCMLTSLELIRWNDSAQFMIFRLIVFFCCVTIGKFESIQTTNKLRHYSLKIKTHL